MAGYPLYRWVYSGYTKGLQEGTIGVALLKMCIRRNQKIDIGFDQGLYMEICVQHDNGGSDYVTVLPTNTVRQIIDLYPSRYNTPIAGVNVDGTIHRIVTHDWFGNDSVTMEVLGVREGSTVSFIPYIIGCGSTEIDILFLPPRWDAPPPWGEIFSWCASIGQQESNMGKVRELFPKIKQFKELKITLLSIGYNHTFSVLPPRRFDDFISNFDFKELVEIPRLLVAIIDDNK